MSDATLPEGLSLTRGEGGLPRIVIDTPAATGEVYLHGAHVTRWAPAGADEVLWLSGDAVYDDESAIRGGVPVCFPWFGPGRTGDLRPSHGFARTAVWRLVDASVSDDAPSVTLELADADVEGSPGRELWPHAFTARLTTTFGERLMQTFEVTNAGDEPAEVEVALHTYLAVGDIDAVAVEGLAGAHYVDKVLGTRATMPGGEAGVIRFAGETDRVYDSTGDVCVVDGRGDRTITLSKEHSTQTVVWNPGDAKAAAITDLVPGGWRQFVCVETAVCGAGAVTLGAGERHTMTATLSLG